MKDKLLAIQQEFIRCDLCDLGGQGNGIINGNWANQRDFVEVDPTIMFVIDRHDMAILSQRRSPAGAYRGIARWFLEQHGMDLEHYWCTPAVICPTAIPDPDVWPPLEYMPLPKVKQYSACRPRLHREILVVEPEVIIALGNVAVKALWPKNPPKFQTSLGELHTLQIPGSIGPRNFDVLVSHSLSDLHRNEDQHIKGGLWNQVYNHIGLAKSVANHLDALRPE